MVQLAAMGTQRTGDSLRCHPLNKFVADDQPVHTSRLSVHDPAAKTHWLGRKQAHIAAMPAAVRCALPLLFSDLDDHAGPM